MEHSILDMRRAVRRRLEPVVHSSRDKEHARRALCVLHLWETGNNVAEAAQRVRAARSSVHKWRALYASYGEEGLVPQPRGRSEWKANAHVLAALAQRVEEDPQALGYVRSRWSSELLARELDQRSACRRLRRHSPSGAVH